MPKMLLLFSHELTDQQIKDARKKLGINSFVDLPEELKDRWTKIPAGLPTIKEYLMPVIEWIKQYSEPNDYILIQGDFGATYYVIRYAFKNDLFPVYSTTKRISKESRNKDTIITEKVFKHVRYRKYENFKK